MYIYIYVYVINSMILGTVIIMIMNQFTSGNDGFPFSDKPNRTLLQHSHGCFGTRRHVFVRTWSLEVIKKKNAFAEYEFYHVSIWKISFLASRSPICCTYALGCLFLEVQDTSKKKYEFQSLKAVII